MPLDVRNLPTKYWAEAQSIFFRAFEQPHSERSLYVQRECDGKADLAPYVKYLIDCYESDPHHFSRPIVEFDSETFAPLEAGAVLSNRFRIDRKLGEGGMGDVYSAYDETLKETIALKRMHPSLAVRDNTVLQFLRETTLARRARHRSICRVNEFHSHEPDAHRANAPNPPKSLYLTMEFLEGVTLLQRLQDGGPLAPLQLSHYLGQICDGLRVAHEEGIIHRDLKPSNIMIAPDGSEMGRAVILDFGLALTVAASGDPSIPIAGTVAFMAPEQARGEILTPAADIFALGVLIHQALTGELPAPGPPLTRLLSAAESKSVDNIAAGPAQIDRRIPKKWARAILGCMEPDAGRRFQTVEELKEALGIGRPTRRWVAGIAMALGGGAIASGAWYGYNESQKPYDPSPEADYHYKLGLEYARRSTPNDIRSAIDEFESATKADPNFALAWAELADSLCTASSFSVMRGREVRRRIEHAASEAIRLNNRIPKAHAALAYSLSVDLKRWKSAERPLRTVVELNPQAVTPRVRLAGFLGRLGRADEAIAMAKSAVSLEPGSYGPSAQLATELFRALRFDEMRDLLAQLKRTHPYAPEVYLFLCTLHEWKKEFPQAEAALEIAARMPENGGVERYRATLFAAQNKFEEAKRVIEQEWGKFLRGVKETNQIVTMLAAVRDEDRLYQAIENGLEAEDDSVLAIPANPYVRSFRGERRFQHFLKAIRY